MMNLTKSRFIESHPKCKEINRGTFTT